MTVFMPKAIMNKKENALFIPRRGVIVMKMFPRVIRRVGACPHRKHGSL